jgi:fatty acid desaturase
MKRRVVKIRADQYGASRRQALDPAPTSQVRAALRHPRAEVNDSLFAAKLLLCGLLVAGGAVLALQHPLWSKIAGTVLLGCMFAHAAELQHQTLHSLGFRNRRANMIAGIALGMPMLVSFVAYRTAHLRHHRYLGTPLNQEFFFYGDQYGTAAPRSAFGSLRTWLVRFSMVYSWRLLAVNLVRAVRGADFAGESVTTSRGIRRDYYVILAAISAMAGLSLAAGTLLVAWIWMVPLILVAAPLHAAIELPEHFRCETLSEDPFANTRTIRSNRLMTWFTNGNNFHVEHHLMPNMPIERLPDVHAEIRGSLRYFHPTYLDYFLSLRQR